MVAQGREWGGLDREVGISRYKLLLYKLLSIEWIWRRKWQPTPVLLPGESLGQRSLVGYSPGGRRVGHT